MRCGAWIGRRTLTVEDVWLQMQNLCGEVLTYLQNLHSSKKSGVCIIWGGNTLGWFVWPFLSSVVCESVCQALVSTDQIFTFSNIYRHTSPLLTMYHLISSSTNLYWPSTSQYRHILTQYHKVPLITHHLMSHAQYTWSSLDLCSHSLNRNVQLTMSRPCYWLVNY